MDPLTHTLLGANLAATRLGSTSRFAAAALVIGANLPDIDAVFYFTGYDDFALGFRRGWTHGVLALVVLPFVLTAILMGVDRIRPDAARPVRPRQLLLLSALAILTHPFLDWLNTYGMRWLMPFDGTWFYGDSVYIMDPWLWLILGVGWLTGRRASWVTVGLWLFFTAALVRVVGNRSPEYLPVIGIVAAVLLIALLWKPPVRSIARVALAIAAIYVGGRLIVHAIVVRDLATNIEFKRVMAGPHPIDPTRWSVTVLTPHAYRFGTYRLGKGLALHPETLPPPIDAPEVRAARAHPSVQGFVTWMRFPSYVIERTGNETRVTLYDARRRGRGRVVVLTNAAGTSPSRSGR